MPFSARASCVRGKLFQNCSKQLAGKVIQLDILSDACFHCFFSGADRSVYFSLATDLFTTGGGFSPFTPKDESIFSRNWSDCSNMPTKSIDCRLQIADCFLRC